MDFLEHVLAAGLCAAVWFAVIYLALLLWEWVRGNR